MSSVVWQHSGLVKSIEGWAPPCIILTRSPKISPSPDWTVRQPSATRLPIHLGFGKYWHSELLHSARTFAIFDVDNLKVNVEHFHLTFHLPDRHGIDLVWILSLTKAQLNDHVGWVLIINDNNNNNNNKIFLLCPSWRCDAFLQTCDLP